ncbi:ATP-binding protein, partial [Campylobacter coli]|nr:ATP-binding protein [Campylobacter coli]
VSRSIADFEEKELLSKNHILEALSFRMRS